MKDKLVKQLFIIIPLILGFIVPYVVHIELNMFDATFVTIKDILSLWVGFPLFCFIVSGIIYIEKYGK